MYSRTIRYVTAREQLSSVQLGTHQQGVEYTASQSAVQQQQHSYSVQLSTNEVLDNLKEDIFASRQYVKKIQEDSTTNQQQIRDLANQLGMMGGSLEAAKGLFEQSTKDKLKMQKFNVEAETEEKQAELIKEYMVDESKGLFSQDTFHNLDNIFNDEEAKNAKKQEIYGSKGLILDNLWELAQQLNAQEKYLHARFVVEHYQLAAKKNREQAGIFLDQVKQKETEAKNKLEQLTREHNQLKEKLEALKKLKIK